MKTNAKRLGPLMILPATAALMLLGSSPSMAEPQNCKVEAIGVGVLCSKESKPTNTTPANNGKSPLPPAAPAAPPAQQQEVPPVVAEPEAEVVPVPEVTVIKETTIIKEVEVPVPAPAAPAPVAVTPDAPPSSATTPSPSMTVTPSAPSSSAPASALAITAEQAGKSNETVNLIDEASNYGPYIFFVGLVGLIAMLITAKSKKLFPFEDGTHRA